MARTALVAALLLLPACATTPYDAGRSSFLEQHEGPATVLLHVENDNWLPVQVFALWSNTRYYIGEIPAGSSVLYQLPGEIARGSGGLRLLADPIGSANEFTTDPIAVGGVHRIEWRLRKNLYSSRPIVR